MDETTASGAGSKSRSHGRGGAEHDHATEVAEPAEGAQLFEAEAALVHGRSLRRAVREATVPTASAVVVVSSESAGYAVEVDESAPAAERPSEEAPIKKTAARKTARKAAVRKAVVRKAAVAQKATTKKAITEKSTVAEE